MGNIVNTIEFLRDIQKNFYELNGGYLENQERIKDILVKKYSIDETEILELFKQKIVQHV